MNTAAEAGRVVLSLAVVLGLMWGLARFVKRPTRTRDGKILDVMVRQQLSRNSSIAVVRVLDQALIVGVTDGQVTLIGEVDLEAAELQLELAAPQRKLRSDRHAAADLADRSDAAITTDAITTDGTVTIPSGIPGADLLNKASRTTGSRTAGSRTAGSRTAALRTAALRTQVTKQGRIGTPKTTQDAKSSPLSGSVLSPTTWRQTVESLRDFTVRPR